MALWRHPTHGFLEDRVAKWGSVYDTGKSAVILGAGANGTVYAGRVRETGREVALKVVGPYGMPLREYNNLVMLDKRLACVPTPVCLDRGADYYLIAMERMYATLHTRMSEMSAEQSYDAAVQLSAILDAMEKQGIRHDDLHTKNVAFDANDRVKLIDVLSVLEDCNHSTDREVLIESVRRDANTYPHAKDVAVLQRNAEIIDAVLRR